MVGNSFFVRYGLHLRVDLEGHAVAESRAEGFLL